MPRAPGALPVVFTAPSIGGQCPGAGGATWAARMRALPFARIHTPRSNEVVGHTIHMDFHTGLPPSRPHGFLHHCSVQDDASRFGRMYPTHRQTADVALDCLRWFVADLRRECGRPVVVLVVLCDNVPFDSDVFKNGCANWPTGPIKVVLTGYYAHQQAGRIERFHGVRMATARVLLRYAKVPGTWWPFATSHANLVHNILPSSADRARGPLAFLRDAPVSWKAERVEVFGHFSMVWLAPPQRGETAKQLADRARPGIYLGRAAPVDNSVTLDSHFFLLDDQTFVRAAHYRVDYSRPPPGWPLSSTAAPRSVDVLSELLSLPDSIDVGSCLLDELPLPNSLLPEFAEQEGGTQVPPHLLDSLPNVEVTSICPSPPSPPTQPLFTFDTFDVTPPVEDEHPATPVFQTEETPDPSPAPSPAPCIEAADLSPASTDICSTTGCSFPNGHAGPCSVYLPATGQSSDGLPSSNLRPRRRAQLGKQESSNILAFLFRTMVFTSTAFNAVQEGDVPIPDFLFATAYDNSLFVAQPDTATSIPIPRGIRQALASDHREQWLEAIFKEYTAILSHNVFEVVRRVDCPAGINVMRNHCIFTVKPNQDGSIERFKCRLVADGNSQTYGVNFTDIFATVVKFSTFRMALHIAAVRDYNITAIDISTAFLYGNIDSNDCYMQMPAGLPRYDADGYELVCHLKKSLYGLRQAPRIWFNHFKTSLESFGFKQSAVDPCLFIYADGCVVIYGLLWVDDLVLLDNSSAERDRFVKYLKAERRYTLTDKGVAEWLLGISLTRDRAKRTITLSQELYIKNMLERFSVYMDKSNARSFDVPALDELASFSSDQCPLEGTAEFIRMQPLHGVYMAIIGCLIWISSCTLPHLCIATNVLSRFSISPSERNFAALIRVLLYLRKHPSETLTLGGTGPDAETLHIVTDASHDEGPSVSGVLVVMGTCVIDWICRRQKTTSRSSLESEAKANGEGAQDGIHKRELAKEFGVNITTTSFWTDSDSSIKLHKDSYACKKSKHIIRVINMLREWIQTLVYSIRFLPGVKNYADIMTKPLPLEPFRRFRDSILQGQIVFPTAPVQSAHYCAKLAAFLDRLTRDWE